MKIKNESTSQASKRFKIDEHDKIEVVYMTSKQEQANHAKQDKRIARFHKTITNTGLKLNKSEAKDLYEIHSLAWDFFFKQVIDLKIATVESYIKIIRPFTIYSPGLDIEDLPRFLKLKFNSNPDQSQFNEKSSRMATKHETIIFKFLNLILQNRTYIKEYNKFKINSK